jgi:oligopeptide transport system ATP-binding protein
VIDSPAQDAAPAGAPVAADGAARGPLLQVDNLVKYYPIHGGLLRRKLGDVKAVDDVSFAIDKGEVFGLVGESGCGKSTLGRTVIRLHPATSGRVVLDGEDVFAKSGAELKRFRRRMQIIFQDPVGSLNPRLSAGQALTEVLKVHGRGDGRIKERVAELLSLVNLPADSVGRRPYQFSGGQRQRIGIARALAVEPKVLIADEAVSALDVSVQGQIINLLIELQNRLGLAIIFISHDLRLIRHISHRVLVMYLGRVVETGPSAEVFARPRHPYTYALRNAVPALRPNVARRAPAISGELPSPLNPPSGCAFHTRCPIARPICAKEQPALVERQGKWPVACHFPDQNERRLLDLEIASVAAAQ